ncbi:MAG: hypothetical protein IPH34_09045 [Chitinophagaceae bacterium]|nr:hypothetical protein [Chitinophagaceae bacterium]MBK8606391.1 hypothetical protein [Chitinophagaceae bacterium]MBP6476459.1 hypothetical protein [Chitinophagaceae bacterium]MBP7107784.1 hypothetical protein [Chitinophagaceae bacterium]MBP7316556.1 hypothetical protein [Chitinophagaceae bacterium]
MGKVYFLALCMLVTNAVKGQNENVIIGEIRSSLLRPFLYPNIDTNNCVYDLKTAIEPKQNEFIIIEEATCINNHRQWYVVLFDDKIYYSEKFYYQNQESINKKIESIKKRIPSVEERIEIAITENLNRIEKRVDDQNQENKRVQNRIDSINKEIDKSLQAFREKNLVLWEWSWSYPEYSSFVDVDITIINPYKKKIKYIWFSFKAFNPVDDPVRDGFNGAVIKTVKGVGPIEYSKTGTYEFENVFYSKVIEKMRVSSIKIQFFDGTIKTITNPVEINRQGD